MFLFLFGNNFVLGLSSSSCPCSVQDNVLSCEDHTVHLFPDDLKIEECNIEAEEIREISLSKQPFKHLKDEAFIKFKKLEVINFIYNEIETISANAFFGLSEIRNIHLKKNNISYIFDGAFDNLLRLRTLDVRSNPLLERYTTKAWHFCDLTRKTLSIDGDLEVFKALEKSDKTDDYCREVDNALSIPICPMVGSTLNCTGHQHLQEMACHLKGLNFTSILFDFPADHEPLFVDNYYEAESSSFISDFNSLAGNENHTKHLEKVNLFNSKFDLSALPSLTGSRTKEVILKADTVYLNSPLVINYKLNIQARVVSISAPITMDIPKDMFLNSDDTDVLELWAVKEERFSIGNALMRRRQLGLLEIIDQLPPNTPPLSSEDLCQPLFINSTETLTDLSGWFDKTFLNLNYVVARTIQSAGSNLELASQIATFTLDFGYSLEEMMQDREAYNAAQKFMTVKKLAEQPDIHNVPRYSIDTIADLADVMVDRMTQYRQNEILQEEQLFIAMGRVQDMQIQFDLIEQQQQLYFDTELAILDSIWAATDNSWDFSFDHRNSIEDTIIGAMNASTEAAFQMEEQEFKELLEKAEANVKHMEDVVEKYKSQEGRLQQKAEASFVAMVSLHDNLDSKVDDMNSEIDAFKEAIDDWKHEQEVAAAVDIMFSFFKAFVDVMSGRYGSAIGDIADIILKIKEVIEQINAVMAILKEIDIGGLAGAADPLPTDFKSALQSSTELTKKGPRFDEIKNMATFRMPAFEDATDGEVDGSKAMEACANVADAGHAMTDATAAFADVMLKLANIKDEIRVAEEDLGRAILEVMRIKKMLDDLEEQRENYENYMEDAQKQYEEEVERMENEYHEMSEELREAFRANITEKFEAYKEVFKQSKADYQAQLNELIQSVIDKGYGLKSHSMTQRSMIMELFINFCDTYYYHSFSICDSDNVPLMSDEFEVLLEKLEDIKWNSITSSSNLPGGGAPTKFGPVPITLEDNLEEYRYPITTLKNKGKIDFNLQEYDFNQNFDRFWRVRIDMFRIVLLDHSDKPLASPGTDFGEEIQSLITFPSIFNDTDFYKDSHTFLCQPFFCPADYVTEEDEVIPRSSCNVDQEFSDLNYKPSADGVYTIKLINSDKIENFANLAKVKVEFSGSYIPYNNRMMKWID